MKKWMYLGLAGMLGMLIAFLGIKILEIFVSPDIAGLFPFIAAIVIFVAFYFFIRNRNANPETFPLTTPVPENLQSFHNGLISLGFTLKGELKLSMPYVSKKITQWVYINEGCSIVAHIAKYPYPLLFFLSSFEDDFDVITYYPRGAMFETDEFVQCAVETSLSAALDYHTNRIEQETVRHGGLIEFSELEQQKTLFQKDKFRKASSKRFLQLTGRIILALIAIPVINYIIGVILVFVAGGDVDTTFIGGGLWSMNMIVVFTCLAWGLQPIFWPETVESRKKRKAKQVESPAVAQEEIYPF